MFNISEENKKFLRKVFLIASPIFVQDLFNSMVNLIDTFMIGSLGEESIAAVGLANQVFFIYALIVFGISSASSIFIGQYWGQKNEPQIKKTLGISIISTSVVAITVMILALINPEWIIGIYSDDANVIAIGAVYLRVVIYSYILTAISWPINIALKSVNLTKLPMITTIIALSANAVLNYLFIYVFNMGISGAAYATVIARGIELVVQLILINIYKAPIKGKIKEFLGFDFAFVKEYYKLATPVIMNELVWAVGVSMYTVSYGKVGSAAQASVQIAGSMKQVFTIAGMSVGSSAGIILANYLGAGKRDKAILYSRKFIKLAISLSLIMCFIFIGVAPFIIGTFNITEEVANDAFKVCVVYGFTMMFQTFNYTGVIGILRSGGDTKFSLFVDTLGVWLFGVPLSFLGAVVFKLPIEYVVFLACTEEYSKSFLIYKRVKSNKWANTLV